MALAQRPRRVWECCICGPGGTGKSRGITHILYWAASRWPRLRILVVRQTRDSLTESFLQPWEDEIVRQGDPILEGARRDQRHSYRWANGSELVLGGLDKPRRIFSTNYDIVLVQETVEITEDAWELFYRALRNWQGGYQGPDAIPFQLLLGDTNPDSEAHWLNQRGLRGACEMLPSRHRDNPKWWSVAENDWTEEGRAYMGGLQALSGVRRRRLLDGEWCQAEGAVWPEYDPLVHIVNEPPDISWTFGSIDWGHQKAGVLQVWGVTKDKDLYLLAEWYRTNEHSDWWGARVETAYKEFSLTGVVADPSRDDLIHLLNDRISAVCGREMPAFVVGANNRRASTPTGDMGGLDIVRWMLAPGPGLRPKLYFVRDALREGRDPLLQEKRKPCRTVEEIPSYVWAQDRMTGQTQDKTDDDCEDHGCDALRYACVYAWRRNMGETPKKEVYAPGTLGRTLKWDELEREAFEPEKPKRRWDRRR